MPGRRRPRQYRRRDVAFRRCTVREDAELIARIEAQTAGRPLDLHPELRERVGVNWACIAGLDDARRAALMLQQDRRHVLAPNASLDALRLAIEARGLAHEKASDVEHMNAKVENNQVLHLGQIRLLAVDVVAGAERYPPPGRFADRSGIDDLADLSYGL